ncbi:RDD family protein [Verrucomicrobia bacterium LW23]|nr:RDD family protein [Verrucomicrobia bacterium LW23]
MDRFNTLRLRTPEGIAFSHTLASPVARLFALAIDLLILAALLNMLGLVWTVIYIFSPSLSEFLQSVTVFVLLTFYFAVLELWWRGQTPGKYAMGLRVMDQHGLRLRFSQIVARNLLRYADMLPVLYTVGGLTALLTPLGQRLGDLVAGTVVVRDRRRREPDVNQIMGGKYNSFRQYPHLEARLRQRADPEIPELALAAILRREDMEPESRRRLFAEFADYFRTITEFPDDVTLGLTDEQYVRNSVDSIFNATGRAAVSGEPVSATIARIRS